MRKRTEKARAEAYAKGIIAAYALGRDAALAGQAASTCPYKHQSYRLSFMQGFEKEMRKRAMVTDARVKAARAVMRAAEAAHIKENGL